MKEELETNKAFQIIFNNRIIQIDYDTSFQKFKNETVKSLIELVLDELSRPGAKKEINNYNLFCPCGSQLELSKHLSENLCEHKCLDINNKKNLGEKYLLIEKQDEKLLNRIQQNEQPLSQKEFDEIFAEKKQNKPKKLNKIKKKENTSTNIKPFIITDTFKKRIKNDIVKNERAQQLLQSGFNLFYNEDHLKTLLSMGIDEKKAKAALRISKDQLEDAILYATDKDLNWDGKEILSYDNKDLIDSNNLNENLKNEVKKEYPFLNDEQVTKRIMDIFEVLAKQKAMKEDNKRRRNPFLGNNSDENEDDDEDDSQEDISF